MFGSDFYYLSYTSMKVKNPLFHSHFLNKDISVTDKAGDKDNIMTFSGVVFEVSLEGSVSQIFFI